MMVTRKDIGTVKYPKSEQDWEFRKGVACELVFAWQDATSPDVRASLERVMFNVGLVQEDGQWILDTRHGGKMVIR
jgi:hypothetical protein